MDWGGAHGLGRSTDWSSLLDESCLWEGVDLMDWGGGGEEEVNIRMKDHMIYLKNPPWRTHDHRSIRWAQVQTVWNRTTCPCCLPQATHALVVPVVDGGGGVEDVKEMYVHHLLFFLGFYMPNLWGIAIYNCNFSTRQTLSYFQCVKKKILIAIYWSGNFDVLKMSCGLGFTTTWG